MSNRALVIDANILIRAVLGQRVRNILEAHWESVSFLIPDIALSEAEEHLAELVTKRGADPSKALHLIRAISNLAILVNSDTYGNYETEARRRLGSRDPDDWPILAAALAIGCPIWAEDADFFGCGVATWTSSNIEIFLAQ